MRKLFFIFGMLLILQYSCRKEPELPAAGEKVELGNTTIDTVSYFSAQLSTYLTSTGGEKIIQHGHCWSKEDKPDLNDAHTSLGSLTTVKLFSSNLESLDPDTKYFIRPYVSLENTVVYGGQVQFFTLKAGKPLLNTSSVTDITINTALCGGNVLSDSGYAITVRGVCWDTIINPTIAGSHTTDGNGTGTFVSILTGLLPNTLYYVRAYATNNAGTNYGNEHTFTSLQIVTVPTLITDTVINITQTSAQSGGNITSDGGAPVTARGICWSTSINPTLENSFTLEGEGTGMFTSYMTGLTPSSLYYVRAYATNSMGTAYGNQKNFSTLNPVDLPTVITDTVINITQTSAQSGGNVTSDGGAPVTARGICWSTSPNPTTANSYTANGSGTGSFTSNLTGLTPNTHYYLRAYAINNAGTAYGGQRDFTTTSTGWICGDPITINHSAGNVAPVTKTVTYGTVTNIPGETSKCWITRNLGADRQATSVSEAAEAPAGWYWQFNRKQGFKHDGTTRTPNTTWISSISENSEWQTANDPCTIELGSGWRIPTYTEWSNLDNAGSWNNWNGPWNSSLKLHASGILDPTDGSLEYRGSQGFFWSRSQFDNSNGRGLAFHSFLCSMYNVLKADGRALRCLRD